VAFANPAGAVLRREGRYRNSGFPSKSSRSALSCGFWGAGWAGCWISSR